MKLLSFLSSIVLLCIVFLAAPEVQAFEIKNGDSVRIEKNQTVEGSLFAAGSSVVVDGVVHGDVYCAGQQVTISGTVDGDIICAGQSFVIDGVIGGNVRAVGQTIQIAGSVKRNVTTMSQLLSVLKEGVVGGEITSAGQSLTVDGKVGKGILAAVDTLTVSKAASVSGAVVQKAPPETKHNKKPVVQNTPVRSWPMNAWPSIIFFVILSCLMVALFPKYMTRVAALMIKDGVPLGLKGAVILMATPIVLFFVFITIIGIPFSIALFMLYCLAIGISRVFVAGVFGTFILEKLDVKQKANMYIQMLVGVPVLWFIFKMPFVGGLVGFLAVCWGLGGMYMGFKSAKK
jgi:cytoskeletal protein CcmA (bactofilin family)